MSVPGRNLPSVNSRSLDAGSVPLLAEINSRVTFRAHPRRARSCAALDVRWRTRFARLLRRYGVARMARALEVDPTAIYQWVRGSVSPRPSKAILVISLVRPLGRLRLEEIYAQRALYAHADHDAD